MEQAEALNIYYTHYHHKTSKIGFPISFDWTTNNNIKDWLVVLRYIYDEQYHKKSWIPRSYSSAKTTTIREIVINTFLERFQIPIPDWNTFHENEGKRHISCLYSPGLMTLFYHKEDMPAIEWNVPTALQEYYFEQLIEYDPQKAARYASNYSFDIQKYAIPLLTRLGSDSWSDRNAVEYFTKHVQDPLPWPLYESLQQLPASRHYRNPLFASYQFTQKTPADFHYYFNDYEHYIYIAIREGLYNHEMFPESTNLTEAIFYYEHGHIPKHIFAHYMHYLADRTPCSLFLEQFNKDDVQSETKKYMQECLRWTPDIALLADINPDMTVISLRGNMNTGSIEQEITLHLEA